MAAASVAAVERNDIAVVSTRAGSGAKVQRRRDRFSTRTVCTGCPLDVLRRVTERRRVAPGPYAGTRIRLAPATCPRTGGHDRAEGTVGLRPVALRTEPSDLGNDDLRGRAPPDSDLETVWPARRSLLPRPPTASARFHGCCRSGGRRCTGSRQDR